MAGSASTTAGSSTSPSPDRPLMQLGRVPALAGTLRCRHEVAPVPREWSLQSTGAIHLTDWRSVKGQNYLECVRRRRRLWPSHSSNAPRCDLRWGATRMAGRLKSEISTQRTKQRHARPAGNRGKSFGMTSTSASNIPMYEMTKNHQPAIPTGIPRTKPRQSGPPHSHQAGT